MKGLIRLAAATVLLLGANGAFAQVVNTDDNTDAGTTISNAATVSYSVEGVLQSTQTGTAEFKVDRAILVTVASVAGDDAVPGGTDQPLEFTVTNDSNATLDFALSIEQPAPTATPGAAGDDFDVTNWAFFLDVNDGDTTVEAGEGEFDGGDTPIASEMIDNLAEEETVTIFVVADIPGGATPPADADTSEVILIATAYETNGTDLVAETNITSSNEDPATEGVPPATNVDAMFVDTVFGDQAGAATATTAVTGAGPVADDAGDDAQDGHHSAMATYTIATASITVTKSSVVVEDPFNGTTNPKAIPGAVIRYCIAIQNDSDTAADNVTVVDNVPLNTDYKEGTLYLDTDCDISAGATLLDDDAADTGAEDDTLTTINRGNVTAAAADPEPRDVPGEEGVVTTVDVELPADSTTTTIFDVIIR